MTPELVSASAQDDHDRDDDDDQDGAAAGARIGMTRGRPGVAAFQADNLDGFATKQPGQQTPPAKQQGAQATERRTVAR